MASPACFHSYQRTPQLHTAPRHESAQTSIPLHPRYPARAASAAMPLGRRILARQVEQPHKPAKSSVLLLLFRSDRRLTDDGRQFSGNSCEYARWGQHRDAPCRARHIGCSVFDLGRVGTYRAASKSVRNSRFMQFARRRTRNSRGVRSPQKKDACPPLSHPTVPAGGVISPLSSISPPSDAGPSCLRLTTNSASYRVLLSASRKRSFRSNRSMESGGSRGCGGGGGARKNA